MSLFFPDNRPGPGVAPDEPRKTGLKRIGEMISRDYISFWLAGLLNLLGFFPFLLGVGYSYATHSLLIAILNGVLGGVLAAPGFYGLADTLLRSLRDEPGYWWHTYRETLKKNWKGTLLPGALAGVIFSLQLFVLLHMQELGWGALYFAFQLLSMLVFLGLFLWGLAQQALMEMSLAALLKNSLLLFLRYLGKTLQSAGLCLVFLLVVLGMFPNSVFVLLIFGFWLPGLCAFQIIYPVLDEVFAIEKTLNAVPDGEFEE